MQDLPANQYQHLLHMFVPNFTPRERRAEQVDIVMLSYRIWENQRALRQAGTHLSAFSVSVSTSFAMFIPALMFVGILANACGHH